MRMFLNKFSGKRKAQEIVQFAIIAPILILFLLIITDFGTAIIIKNAVSDATRASVIRLSNLNRIDPGTQANRIASIKTFVTDGLNSYFADHNIKRGGTFSVDVAESNGNYSVSVTYLYKSFFPGFSTIPLQTSQALNYALIEGNTYSVLTTQNLSSFNNVPKGTMLNGEPSSGYNIRNVTAILVSWFDDYDLTGTGLYNNDIYARLFSWYGEDLLPQNLRINLRTGRLEVRSPYYNAGNWLNTKIPYVWVVSALGYTQVIYTKYNGTGNIDAVSGVGEDLNACNMGTTCIAKKHQKKCKGFFINLNSCPYQDENAGGGINYYETYRINPLLYKNDFYIGVDANDRFNQSFGYRWCDSEVGTGACESDDMSGKQTIQELALKGLTRESWYDTATPSDYVFNLNGNYEYVADTNAAPPDLNNLYHYVAYTPNYGAAFDGKYLVNIYQPLINDINGNYSNGTTPIDYARLTDPNGPFYKAFQWDFRLNLVSGVLEAGLNNANIIDVYLDNDGDGIPNNWDNHPQYFDANANGQLDGMEYAVGFVGGPGALDTENPVIGIPYVFPSIANPIAGMGDKYIISTPEIYLGGLGVVFTMPSSRAAPAALILNYPFGAPQGSLIPLPYYANFKVYDNGLGLGDKLYIPCGLMGGKLCRKYPIAGSLLPYIYNNGVGNLAKSPDITRLEGTNFNTFVTSALLANPY